MRLALAQLNPTIGDLEANARRIADAAARAAAQGADLLAVPELAISGYPPKDLVLHAGFVEACEAAARHAAAQAPATLTLVIGTPRRLPGGGIANSLLVFRGGQQLAAYDKRLLPTYDVFDEDRYFTPGSTPVIVDVAGVRVGLAICEDLWKGEDAGFSSRYLAAADPVADLARLGTHLLLVPSASPFVLGKGRRHRHILTSHATRHNLWVAAVNQVGGNDDLVFDGHAAVFDPQGHLRAAAPGFEEHILYADIEPGSAPSPRRGSERRGEGGGEGNEQPTGSTLSITPMDAGPEKALHPREGRRRSGSNLPGSRSESESPTADPRHSDSQLSTQHSPLTTPPDPLLTTPDPRLLLDALTLGTRDYLAKTGFRSAVIGLSGGIDSAITAAIACRAIGPANVLGLAMPSRYSSTHSVEDAHDLARRLTMPCLDIPIAQGVATASATLNTAFAVLNQPALGQALPDLTEENLQSRLRGLIIMGVSNRTGAIVLTTGNKSELAVGYCTLYGDMNGGLAVLSDVPKTAVYRLAAHLNENWQALGFPAGPIPPRSITKPPSAELRPDQTDQDSLPPYDVLDQIVERYVERRESARSIISAAGLDPATVLRVIRMIDLAEYKRKQLAIGLKVTGVAFGQGRRMPIAQRWRERE